VLGFIYANGRFSSFNPGNTSFSSPMYNNDLGQVAGYYLDSGVEYAFLGTPTGLLTVATSDPLTTGGASVTSSDLIPGSALAAAVVPEPVAAGGFAGDGVGYLPIGGAPIVLPHTSG